MSTKSDYTAEEWKTVVATPYYTAMLIVVSDLNVAYFKEIAALGKAIMASTGESASELIKAVAVDFSSKETQNEIKPELEKLKGEKDPVALKQAMYDYITGTTDLITEKSAPDGEDYRKWLLYLAQKTAEGSKEGGFLGIGAVRVSDKEQAELDKLAETLGVGTA